MSLNSEQTARVKNAVKQKLVEIGAYVDDQLSDYVMIMITNRKTEKQMTEDLELFLGGMKQSAEFSAWLHSYIKKVTSNEKETTTSSSSVSSSSSHKKHTTSKQSSNRKSSSSSAAASVPITQQLSTSNQQESDELAIQIESNEFNDDFSEEPENKKKQDHSKSAKKASPSKSKPKVEEPVKIKPQITPTKTSTREPAKQETVKSEAIKPTSTTLTTTKPTAQATPTTVSSKVIAVKQDTQEEDEEEKTSDKTRLSSVIKISDRKYTVPKSMQPNKSILLKAVDDANKSSTTSSRPKSIADEKLAELRSKRFGTTITTTTTTSEDENKQQQQQRERYQRRDEKSITKRLKKSMSPSSEDRRQAVLNESSLDAEFKQVSKQTSSIFLNMDRRQVQIETHKRIAVADEHDRIDVDEEVVNTASQQQEPAKEPKFIVTLSGLNDETFLKKFSQTKTENKRTLDDMEDEDEEMSQQQQQIDEQMEGADDEDQMELEEQKPNKNKILIRCTFWPQCEKGDLCPYLHPNKPCTAFPNCTFGQQCHYLHPSCRYDGYCTRLDCIYTHLIKKPVASTAVPAQIQQADLNKDTQSQPVLISSTTTEATSTTAQTLTSESPTKQIAPKVTINKIQSSTYLNNVTSASASGEQIETGIPTSKPTFPSRRSAPSLGYFKQPGFAFATNQYTLVNRAAAPAVTTPCKFGNMCKNPKCFYTHPNIPQVSQLKWTAALQNTTNTQQMNVSVDSSSTDTKIN